jgi:putative inorganic carbon (hco3(-)) transporter
MARIRSVRLTRAAGGLAGVAAAVCALALLSSAHRGPLMLLAVAAVALPLLAYVVFTVDPAWTLTAGILLSVFSSNWGAFGLPSGVAPDRLVLLAGVIALAIRTPGARYRPLLRPEPVHWVLLLAVLYALCSAVAAGTIDSSGAFKLVDRYGAAPFLLFFLAPIAFATARQRAILLGGLVILGGYLGFTAMMETVGPKALVIPHYIVDQNVGIHPGRTRGPFTEAETDGQALFVSAVACGVAVVTWRGRWVRVAAALIGIVCVAGTILPLERSVWLGSAAGLLAIALFAREVRRFAIPVIATALLLIVVTLAVVPGLADRVHGRKNDEATVWDRKNQNRAGLNMLEARPLFGFGWNEFLSKGPDYFVQDKNYPLTASEGFVIHNMFLTHLAELGLVGTAIWLVGLLMALGGAFLGRAPPELRAWQVGLIGVAVAWVIVANAVYMLAYPVLILWVWAGIVYGGRVRQREPEHATVEPEPVPGARLPVVAGRLG